MQKSHANTITLVLVTVLIAGCSSSTTTPAWSTAEPLPTTTSTVEPSPTAMPTSQPSPTATAEPSPTATPTPEPMPTATVPAPLVLYAPPGNPPILDGKLAPGEWDGALRQEFTDGGELLLMHSDGYLYLGIHANFDMPGGAVASVCLARGDQVFILHSSASLGTAIFQRDDSSPANGTQWQATQTFEWALNKVIGYSAQEEQQRQQFLQENHWLANLGTMSSSEEFEYQIALPDEPFSIAAAYLLPPRASKLQAAWWPASLADDCHKITLLQGDSGQRSSTPLRLKFAPETWATVAISTDAALPFLATNDRSTARPAPNRGRP